MHGSISTPADIASSRLRYLYEYWTAACAGRAFPLRSAIAPTELPPDLLPQMFIADVLHDPLDFRFRLAGTQVVENAGLELTGHLLSELPLAGLEPIITEYETTVARSEPRYSTHDYTSANGYVRTVERLILPLSRSGDTLDMLTGAFEYHRHPADR